MKLKDTVHYNLYHNLFILFIVIICLLASVSITDADFSSLFTNTKQMTSFLSRFLKPDFSYIPELIGPMFQTLAMSVVGTVLGVLVAIPFSLLATTVVTDNKTITSIFRFLLGIIRTIPNLLLAALLVAIIGIGEFTGVMTIAIFTFGMVSQLIYESIETIDYLPIEATYAVGANRIQMIFWAIFPQIIASIISYSFYAFEVNVRASTVLGYVGAGGIGVILNSSLALLQYERVSMIILMILLVVWLTDTVSEAIRKRVR